MIWQVIRQLMANDPDYSENPTLKRAWIYKSSLRNSDRGYSWVEDGWLEYAEMPPIWRQKGF